MAARRRCVSGQICERQLDPADSLDDDWIDRTDWLDRVERSDPMDRYTRERRMRALFEINSQPLFRFLLRLTNGQREAAEDLLQETMLRAWRKVEELPTDPTALIRWLYIVARRLAIDAARARMARPAEVCSESVTWLGAADDEFERLLDRCTLREALLRLTPEHRNVLIELYYADSSVLEAAGRIGIPPGTVRSRSFYALRLVRSILKRAEAASVEAEHGALA